MTTRKELIEALGAWYRDAATNEKSTILAPVRSRLYDEAVRQALVVLWDAGDQSGSGFAASG